MSKKIDNEIKEGAPLSPDDLAKLVEYFNILIEIDKSTNGTRSKSSTAQK